MSASSDLQEAITALLEAPGALPVAGIPVLRRRAKELQSDIEAAIAAAKLCIFVMPGLPTRALPDTPFVFFSGYEVRVRIVEQPKLNDTGADAYDLVDAVALALQWQNPGGMLANPLQLSPRPAEAVEDHKMRIIDVIFDARLQINQTQ